MLPASDSVGYIKNYEYNNNSQLTESNRNELHTSYKYDALGQLTELTTIRGYDDIMNFAYEYDKIGNIVSEVREESNVTNNRTYQYDSANQLVSFSDNEYVETYSYDNAGNMLEKVINDTATSYSYNAGNQLIKELTNGSEIGYNYNANGDIISKTTGEDYTYDIMGNLTSIIGNGINQSFTYNGSGHRMSKTDDGETIYYVNDINLPYEQVLQTYGDDGQVINTYSYGVERIQSVGETNETYLYDGRGSVVGAIGQDNILESYSYTAYGELMPNSPKPKVWGYNGEATDSKTGLQYLRARYYDSSINRFMCEDDYRGDFTNPISMNRYVYVHNNPVMGIDPSGYYMSGVPSNIKSALNKKRAIKESNKYIQRYGGGEAVKNAKASRGKTYRSSSSNSSNSSNSSDKAGFNPQNATSWYDEYLCAALKAREGREKQYGDEKIIHDIYMKYYNEYGVFPQNYKSVYYSGKEQEVAMLLIGSSDSELREYLKLEYEGISKEIERIPIKAEEWADAVENTNLATNVAEGTESILRVQRWFAGITLLYGAISAESGGALGNNPMTILDNIGAESLASTLDSLVPAIFNHTNAEAKLDSAIKYEEEKLQELVDQKAKVDIMMLDYEHELDKINEHLEENK